jgi:hypothetical protein
MTPEEISKMKEDLGITAIAQKVDGIPKAFEDAFKPLEAKLADLGKKPAVPDAKLKEGVLGGLTKMEVWDIPIGQVVVGGFVAVFATELVDGFMANQKPMVTGLVKLALAGASIKWGKRVLGKDGALAVAILVGFDGVRDIIPLDTWAKTFASKLSGMMPKGGLAQNPNRTVEQARIVATNYYSRLGGR